LRGGTRLATLIRSIDARAPFDPEGGDDLSSRNWVVSPSTIFWPDPSPLMRGGGSGPGACSHINFVYRATSTAKLAS